MHTYLDADVVQAWAPNSVELLGRERAEIDALNVFPVPRRRYRDEPLSDPGGRRRSARLLECDSWLRRCWHRCRALRGRGWFRPVRCSELAGIPGDHQSTAPWIRRRHLRCRTRQSPRRARPCGGTGLRQRVGLQRCRRSQEGTVLSVARGARKVPRWRVRTWRRSRR